MPRKRPAAAKAAEASVGPAWSIPSLREPRYSQSLERGLAILGSFTPERPVMGIADIAEELGMSRSTTHRYVITLVALGYLEQGASRKYRLGLRVTDLGMSALNSTGLREHARPYLEELRQRTSYTTGLGVLDGTEVLYVEHLSSFRRAKRPAQPEMHSGSRLPAYCTAMGKAILAFLPEESADRIIEQIDFAKRGPNTITDAKAFRAELAKIRETGIAVNDEELAYGLRSIGAPIHSYSGEVTAALNLAIHRTMGSMDELIARFGPAVAQTAQDISRSMGHRAAATDGG
jgi:IclR family pca regulon transcriptional regulator